MICTKKTAILTLSLATTWSVNALAQPPNSISQPPIEAYTACEGKQPGEQSSFVTQAGNTISGQCKQQQGGRLILIPDHLREVSKIPPIAYQNCIGKKLGDAAQVTIPTGKTIFGTCQLDGDRLYLRPDSPLGMNVGMHAGMKTHNGGQYQEFQNGSRQPDTRQQAPEQNGNRQQQVPEELPSMYTACDGKKAGDAARLVDQYGQTITGTCESNGKRLFLRPDDSPVQAAEGIQPKSKPAKQPQKVVPPKSKPKEKPEGLFARLKKFLGGVVDSL